MSTLDVVAYAGRGVRRRPAGQLPRHRRRRLGRGDGQRPGDRPVRPGRAQRPGERLRRHHLVRRGRQRDRVRDRAAGRARASRSAIRSWSGWTATTPPRAAGSSTRRASPSSSRSPRWTMRRGAPPSWPPRPRLEHEMAIFLTGDSKIIVQGITGSEGRKHGARMIAAGTKVVGGTNPRKAGQTVDLGGTERAGVRHRRRGDGGDRRRRVGRLRAPGGHQGRRHRGDRRADPAGHRDHRGRPGARHAPSSGRTPARAATRPGSSARTAPASPRPASPTRASSRPTSPPKAGSGWCRSRAR